MENQKINIRDFEVLLKCIKSISDVEYQQRIWVRHEDPNIVDSYDDTTMYFIEDSDAILEDPSDVIISEKQYTLLKELNEKVETYDLRKVRPYDDKEIVDDPEWDQIRKLAKKVYEELIK